MSWAVLLLGALALLLRVARAVEDEPWIDPERPRGP